MHYLFRHFLGTGWGWGVKLYSFCSGCVSWKIFGCKGTENGNKSPRFRKYEWNFDKGDIQSFNKNRFSICFGSTGNHYTHLPWIVQMNEFKGVKFQVCPSGRTMKPNPLECFQCIILSLLFLLTTKLDWSSFDDILKTEGKRDEH